MKYAGFSAICFLLMNLFTSCQKETKLTVDCWPDNPVVRQIMNAEATIKELNGNFSIVIENSIDSKLIPCNLPEGFQVNGLKVIVSGDVKSPAQPGPGPAPCCSEPFVITKISK